MLEYKTQLATMRADLSTENERVAQAFRDKEALRQQVALTQILTLSLTHTPLPLLTPAH